MRSQRSFIESFQVGIMYPRLGLVLVWLLVAFLFKSCGKLEERGSIPELETLMHGLKTSSLVEYCASVAISYFIEDFLPVNAEVLSRRKSEETDAVLISILINDDYPLPFNSSRGQLTIAGIWSGTGGVLSALFTDIDIIERRYEFRGLYTIPLAEQEDGSFTTLFAEQDIVIGEGSDTLLHLNMGTAEIELELDRLGSGEPSDPFVAAGQNVWFISFDPKEYSAGPYDDVITINGGGQVAGVSGSTGGVMYHALINTRMAYSQCPLNPVHGVGFIQNLKAGSSLDLGHAFLDFHPFCDGKAYVEFAFGKYLLSNQNYVELEW